MPAKKAVKEHMVNGLDVGSLMEMINSIKGDSALASFKFRAGNRWINSTRNRSEIPGFYGAGQERRMEKLPFELFADEPRVLLGTDTAPNPVEHLLNALASCLTTAMVCHAAARGIKIEEVESTLEGNIDVRGFLGINNDARKGCENISVTFHVKSDATPEELEEYARFSPVLDVVSNGTDVMLKIEKK